MLLLKTIFVSKSKYAAGLQCPKLLWYYYNRKEDVPTVDTASQAIMDQGRLVGEVAQSLYPSGITIVREFVPDKQAAKSLEAAKLRKPLFEAGFVYKQAYALADILNPVEKNAWEIIEVKSTTQVKEEHYSDVAFQKYTYEGAGLKIRKCYLMYINNQYVRKGTIDPHHLFATEDITKQCEDFLPEIEQTVANMLQTISSRDAPYVKVGPHCDTPWPCPLVDVCWSELRDKDSIFALYYGRKKAYEFMGQGLLRITDIRDDVKINPKQKIQISCHRSGTPYINKEGIREFLKGLQYPLYFLDFETISPAIPLYDNSRPYEYIPFQYSLYIMKTKNSEPEHCSYLAPGKTDPRPEILKQLKALLGTSGSIIAYNATFEKTTLRHATEAYPEYQGWLAGLEERIVDLLVPFRNFLYYHPNQAGSASLKAVLPALTSFSYETMEISEGTMASIEYSRVTFGKNIDEKERQRVYNALEKYCNLDTKGMMEIVRSLERFVT